MSASNETPTLPAATLRALGVNPAWVTRVEPLRPGIGGGRLWRLWLRVPITSAIGPASAHATPPTPAGASDDALTPDAPGSPPTAGRSAPARWSGRRVVKALAPLDSWLGVASADTRMREVSLWSSGLLADLPASLATAGMQWGARGRPPPPTSRGQGVDSLNESGGAIPSAAVVGDPLADDGWGDIGAALLMRDVTARLWRRPPPGRLPTAVGALLDDLARLHTRFWADPRLDDANAEAIGLTSPRAALLLTAPAAVAARLALGDANPYLPQAQGGWQAFFALAAPADAVILRQAHAQPEPYLRAIAALPHTLIHGDVWAPNLGRLPPTRIAPRRGSRTLLLDWALAAAAPATYDPLWLCGTWRALDPVHILAAYRARLARRLAARGVALPAAVWRGLADAGYLRTALTCGEAFGRAAYEARGTSRRRAEARARWWAARGAQAARRLAALGDA